VIWVMVLTSMALLFGLMAAQRHYHWSGRTFILVQSGFWAVYMCVLVVLILMGNRGQRRIRQEEGLPAQQTSCPSVGKYAPLIRVVADGGAVSWMIGLAAHGRDTLAISIIVAWVAALLVGGSLYMRRRAREQFPRIVITDIVLIGLLTFIMLNWRFYGWVAAMSGISAQVARQRMPLWTLNIFMGVIFAVMMATAWGSMRRGERSSY